MFITQGTAIPFLVYKITLNLIHTYFLKHFALPTGTEVAAAKQAIVFAKNVLTHLGLPPAGSSKIVSGGAVLWGANHVSYRSKILPLTIENDELKSQISLWKDLYRNAGTPAEQSEAFSRIKTLSDRKLALSHKMGEVRGSVSDFVVFASEKAKDLIINS